MHMISVCVSPHAYFGGGSKGQAPLYETLCDEITNSATIRPACLLINPQREWARELQ